MAMSMEKLADKVENMTLGEFNEMMYKFIDKVKKVMNIKKLMDGVDKHINEGDGYMWKGFMSHRNRRSSYEFDESTPFNLSNRIKDYKKFFEGRDYDPNNPDMNYWHPDNDWYPDNKGE